MTTKNRFSRNKYDKLPVRKACQICKIDSIDYKNVGFLKKYISDRGKIESAARTGTCSKCQRNLTVAIKRARHMAFLPIAVELPQQKAANNANNAAIKELSSQFGKGVFPKVIK